MDKELKLAVEESVRLTKQMLDPETGLEAKIKTGLEKELGVADLKEQVNKMAEDNSKAIQTISEAKEEILKSVTERQDEFETKFSGGTPYTEQGNPFKATLKGFDGQKVVQNRGKFLGEFDISGVLNTKTVTSAAASAGDNIVGTYEPGILRPGEQMITLLDVLNRSTTDQPSVYWVAETLASRTNNTTIQSTDNDGTGQGSAFGTSDFVFDRKSAHVRTIGHLGKLAIQTMEDAPQVEAYIRNIMAYMVRYKLEGQVLTGDNTGKNLNGINNQATAFDATLDTTVGLTNQQNLDVVRLAMLQTALTFFPATAGVLHPTDVVGMQLLKNSNGSYLFANPVSGERFRPWGLPVIESTQQSQDTFTVGAMTFVEIAMRRAVEVLISTENDDDFETELASVKATVRAALKVYRPASIITGTFTAAKA